MTRAGIRPAIKAAIEASATFTGVDVVVDNTFSGRSSEAEAALRDDGKVVAILPLLGSSNVDQTGRRISERADVAVYLRCRSGVVFDVDAAVDAILKAVLLQATLEAKVPEKVTELIPEDTGCLTYAIYFSIPLTQPSP